MKKSLLLLGVVVCFFTSCTEKNGNLIVPTIGVEGRGGSDGYGDAPLQISDGGYQIYQGSPYMGEDGRAVNTHYTPYNEREHNYNYYRGSED